jgi:hypothetical protein
VIRDRNLPVAKLVPFIGEDASEQDLLLVAAGKMRLPQIRLDVKKLSKIPTGSVKGNKAIQAAVSDRERRPVKKAAAYWDASALVSLCIHS